MGAKYVIDEYTLRDIADSIREKTGGTLNIAPEDMAEEILSIHSAEDAYNEFWDEYQNPAHVDCDSRFAGRGWNDETFKPKYNIPNNPPWQTSFSKTFANCGITNLSKILKECGVKLDFSKTSRADQMFYWANKITAVPEIDVSNVENCYAMFSTATSLVTIEKFKVSAKTNLNNAFYGCLSLENIVVEGELAYFRTDFSQSTKLSKASIISIIEALSDNVSGDYTLTLSLEAVDIAFDTGKKEGSGSDEFWDLVHSKPNWTISLV